MKAKTFSRLVGAAAVAGVLVVGTGAVGAAPLNGEQSWDSGDTKVTYDGNSTLTVSAMSYVGFPKMADYGLAGLMGETDAPWGYLLSSVVTEVVIMEDVTHIGANAFRGGPGTKLQSVTCSRNLPPTVGTGAFYNVGNLSLFVPATSIDAYLSAPVWTDFGYKNPSTVTFDLNDGEGETPPPQKVSYGDKVEKPDDPTRENYEFDGWELVANGTGWLVKWDFNATMPGTPQVITLKAYWVPDNTPLVTVTFYLNGGDGEPPPPQKVFPGNKVTKPTDPTRDGYEFDGWYLVPGPTGPVLPNPEDYKWDFDNPGKNVVVSDITLKAEWTKTLSVSSPTRSSAPSASPRITLRGHTLSIQSSPAAVSQVRLLDVRGRTVRSFTAGGAMNIPLSGVSAGRYFVEVREGGKRFTQGIVLR